VILEVIAGMAVFLQAAKLSRPTAVEYEMKMRTGLDQDLDGIVREAIEGMIEMREAMSLGMGKLGECLEANYRLRPRKGVEMPELLRALSGKPGVQSVQLVGRSTLD